MTDDLLPSNATAFERAASLSLDVSARVGLGVDAIRLAKLVSIPDSFVPFLIYEYGLGPVSAFVPDQRFLLTSGIAWQRVRGTPEAVARALDWLGYAGSVEEARATRRRWHLFGLALDRVRDAEVPDLEAIEGVVALSVAVRSHFFRAHAGYDVREMEWSGRRWGGTRWSGSSGARLRDGGAKWSFGRAYDFALAPSQADLTALGAWIPSTGTGILGWGSFTWAGAGATTWIGGDAQTRLRLICQALVSRPLFFCFRTAGGAVIGYRRARVLGIVAPTGGGAYQVGAQRYAPAPATGVRVYAEAMTDFGDGDGQTAASVSLVFDAAPADVAAPGRLWIAPGGLTGGTEVMSRPVSIPFGKTVRERVRFLIEPAN